MPFQPGAKRDVTQSQIPEGYDFGTHIVYHDKLSPNFYDVIRFGWVIPHEIDPATGKPIGEKTTIAYIGANGQIQIRANVEEGSEYGQFELVENLPGPVEE